MPCEKKFTAEIPFDCVVEVYNDIRNGNVTVDTAKKVIWIIGCSLESFNPDGPLIVGNNGGLEEATEVAQELSAKLLTMTENTPKGASFNIPPEVWIMLLEMILKLLKKQ